MTTPVAIITGASSGIGAAAARHLHQRGYTVYAAARRVELMAPLGEIGIRPVRVDVTDESSLTTFVAQVVAETGRIDVLVNNAGYGACGALEDVPMAEARRQFDVNMFGLARLTQLVAAPHAQPKAAAASSTSPQSAGKIHVPLSGWYHATKFAVEGFSDALRVDVAPFGIKVVVIEPGAADTEWHRCGCGESAGRLRVRASYADAGRYGGQDSSSAAWTRLIAGGGGRGDRSRSRSPAARSALRRSAGRQAGLLGRPGACRTGVRHAGAARPSGSAGRVVRDAD